MTGREAHRRYLEMLADELRDARRQAVAAEEEWNGLSAAFRMKHREEQRRRAANGRPYKSALMMSQEKSDSQLVSDAFGALQFWMSKAQYVASLIMAEQVLRQELGES